MSRPAGFGGSVVIAAVATALLIAAITSTQRPVRPQARGAPPWPAPAAVAVGVRTAGLELISAPGDMTRYAVHLDVLVNGQPVTVPAGIGVAQRGAGIAALYTNDSSGVVHVTSDATAPVFTLGQFFDEWQVTLTPDRLGGLRGGPVTAYVNGFRVAANPARLVLAPHQEIAVSYGPVRGSVPAGYAFPAGT